MNIEYNLTFNNIEYILYLSTNDTNLNISLEQGSEILYWNGTFDGRYLEEITNKAGSPKSFEVFIKMLMSGLANESENVLVDLLSYKDLEMMRNKKSNSNTSSNNLNDSSSTNQDLSIINKKYLIISYTNEFEKVHYPLPLSFILQPDISYTLRTIERLKKLNQKISSQNVNNNNSFSLSNRGNITSAGSNINNSVINIKDIEELKNENQNLKNKVKLLESHRKLGAVENDEFLRNYTGIKEEYDAYKEESESKIKLLAKTIEDLKLKINYNIDSASLNEEGIDNKKSNKLEKLLKTISELEEKLIKADEIVIKERKTAAQYIDEKNREMEKIKKEIFFMKENEKKLKVKINQLEKDLELANKKTNYSANSKTKSVKSNYSYKSSVKSSTSKSNYSKESVNSKASNPYDKFKGLYNKNYQPFNFFNKNKSKVSSVKSGSYAGSSKGSVYSGISGAKSNGSLTTSKKPPGSKFSSNKNNSNTNTTKANKNYSSNLYSKNYYSNIKSSNYNNSLNKNSANLKSNNYNSIKNTNPYLKNISSNISSKNKTNATVNKNLKYNIKNDKQAILGEYKNVTSTVDPNINNNLSSTLRSNNASRGNAGININVKEEKNINQDEINARLGRIQQLLDTAKI